MYDNKKINIPFSPPDISELEIQYVTDTLRSGWITTGPRTKMLEQLIANWIGTNRCVCLNSQTACAELTLRLLGIRPGDEVITTAYTYTATASVVCHVGAKVILIDCQPNSLEMDYEALEAAITKNTKAIIPVDIAGIPCNYEVIYEIIERKKNLFCPINKIQKAIGRITVVSDAAHAFGASLNGKMIGQIADFTNFSFHAVKNFTVAEGGAVVWRSIDGINDDEIYKDFQLMSLHGQSKDALTKSQLGSWEYDIVAPLYKCNMTDIMAALGLAQFERYPDLLARRKEIIKKYDDAFIPLGIKVLKHYTDSYKSSGHLYMTRVPNITLNQRNDIIIKMAERGVSCNVHYKPLPLLTAYKELGFDIKDYPNAYKLYANEITLPLHTCLTDDQVDYVIKCYCDILKEYIV